MQNEKYNIISYGKLLYIV